MPGAPSVELPRLILAALLVLLFHAYLWRRFMALPRLRFEDYFEPLLVAGTVHRPLLLVFAGIGMGWLALGWRRLRWRTMDPTGTTRVFVFAVAGIMAWAFSTYGFNHFYGQAHLFDRGLLIALWLLVLVHPLFVFPFVLELQIILLQVYYPLVEAAWIWPDKRLPFDSLVLFCAFLFARAAFRVPAGVFWYLTLCLTGASYAHAALRKMLQGPHVYSWLVDNQLSNVVVSAYANGGWLRFLGDEGIVRVASWIRPLDPLLGATTLLIELGGFLVLASRRASLIALGSFPLLHAAILATTGIFFWKWILFDLALLWVLTRLDASHPATGGRVRPAAGASLAATSDIGGLLLLRAPATRWLSAAIIAASPLYFSNVAFSWFDTRFVNYFEIHGVGESGRRYLVHPRFFAPYDMIFQQSRFYYLLREPVITGTYGTTFDHELAQELARATTAEIPEIRQRFGRIWFHPPAAQGFAHYLRHWMLKAHTRAGRPFPPHWLAPPYHFQSSVPPDAFDHQEPLRAVEVEFVEQLFDGDALRTVSRRPVLGIRLDP